MKNTPAVKNSRNGWAWIPTLYFAEGLPYVLVMTVSVIMYKKMGISNTDISIFTSLLYLPWVVKPLWSPVVDIFKTKRSWITSMQFFIALGLVGIALTLTLPNFFIASLVIFALLAFLSATHDIAADGFYMLGLTKHDQSFYVGVRSLFYRIAMIAGQGALVIIAGFLEGHFKITAGDAGIKYAWMITLLVPALFFILIYFYHKFILPRPDDDKPAAEYLKQNISKEFVKAFGEFFRKKDIGFAIAFLLLYRVGESQLGKLASPFLLDAKEKGGLGLLTQDVGFVYGTVGIIALVAGGLLGGFAIARNGLKYWLWWMLFAINIPDLVYVYMAYTQPDSIFVITTCVAIEQLGYGFGFAAYLMFMIYICEGEYKTSHYAIATGFMALGMMIPGMISGVIQEAIGYKLFFVWVCVVTILPFISAKFLKIDPDFGKKA
jgi:MFS transporter, PAT family, beta-lactamase induction signal transducer AmpG